MAISSQDELNFIIQKNPGYLWVKKINLILFYLKFLFIYICFQTGGTFFQPKVLLINFNFGSILIFFNSYDQIKGFLLDRSFKFFF